MVSLKLTMIQLIAAKQLLNKRRPPGLGSPHATVQVLSNGLI